MLSTLSSLEITYWRAFYSLEQREIEEAGRPAPAVDSADGDEITFGEGV